MNISYREASKQDLVRCTEIRGKTKDNALSASQLAAIGVTQESWSVMIEKGNYLGFVAADQGTVIGFCFGDSKSGEILVLAILAGYEGLGIGRTLLSLTCEKLISIGHSELWLATSASPDYRSYGFYRRLGWSPTGTFDSNGDEILRYPVRDRASY